MGYLAVARIPYELWVKFVWKLIAAWLVIAALVLVVGAIWECQPDGWRRDPGDN
ncbi:hypothetical protein [Leucobacter manosquensis]|uniref:Uncharacterized protein n=1 Tax=Leucobacter manosquensis TaxID=2810611 RepID=A0ABS5M5E6_9MICO|nr:hypothetical protein [Leucobacter manosquensis]MBS3182422.1 hypothetical protein [Leucobacter manosquensis]